MIGCTAPQNSARFAASFSAVHGGVVSNETPMAPRDGILTDPASFHEMKSAQMAFAWLCKPSGLTTAAEVW